MQALKVPEKVVVYNRNPYKFVVFGCGGTGAYFVRDLARIIGVYNQQYRRNDSLLLIDGDEVEEHNLARQNFIRPDIGKNKAQVCAERYGSAFGVNTGFIPQYLRRDNMNVILDQLNDCIPVYVSCVDNNKTRHLIHDLYRGTYRNGTVYLDSGNEEHAGQVVFSCTSGFTPNGYHLVFQNSPGNGRAVIKDMVELFDVKPDDRHPDDLSCAERAMHSPQNIATNMMAAQCLFNYCNAILCATAALAQLDQHDIIAFADAHKSARGISAHVTYFNSRTGAVSTRGFEDDVSACLAKYRTQREEWITAERIRLNPPQVEAVVAEEVAVRMTAEEGGVPPEPVLETTAEPTAEPVLEAVPDVAEAAQPTQIEFPPF